MGEGYQLRIWVVFLLDRGCNRAPDLKLHIQVMTEQGLEWKSPDSQFWELSNSFIHLSETFIRCHLDASMLDFRDLKVNRKNTVPFPWVL